MASITATVNLKIDLYEYKILRDLMKSCYSTDEIVAFCRTLSKEEQEILNNLHDVLKSLGD